MVQKLLKLLLSLSLVVPVSAFALGLGDPHLHSSLGERLNANIDLLSVSAADAQGLSVSLASQETFDKVGLDRPAVLMFLRFEVVKNAAGKYSIHVTSQEPIQEPFLDFLVEVDWKSGRVLREYTLLLDPPGAGGRREAPPVVNTPVTAAVGSAEELYPVSAAQQQQQAAQSADQKRAEAAAAKKSAETKDTTAAADEKSKTATGDKRKGTTVAKAPDSRKPMAKGSRPVTTTKLPGGGISYGPVKARETLWRIAERLRPNKNVSIQQMMLALQKANPYAFIDNNINLLKRGYVLRIDDPSLLSAMNQADAVREVARQTRAWEDYRQKVAGRAKKRPAAASATRSTAGVAAAKKSEPKLKLVAPQGRGVDKARASGSAAKTSSDEMSEELMRALESAAAQRKENEALKARMGALEGQIEAMQKIVTIKNSELATLQKQLGEQGKAGAVEPAAGEVPASQKAPETKAATKPVKPEAAAPKAAKPQGAKPEAAKTEKDKAKADKPKPRPKPVVMPVEEPSLLDEIFGFIGSMLPEDMSNILPADLLPQDLTAMTEDPLMLGIVGGAFFFLLVLLTIAIRKRRKGSFQESILNLKGGTSSMMNASEDLGSETSFLSDLAVSGMDSTSVQTDEGEVDPLTEAEVFIAYGRNQQAAEVLKSARSVSPDRADIAAKLLEVYYNSKESAKFEELAEEAVATLQGDDALWGQVLAMGRELCPDNVLFSGAAESGAAPAAAAASATAAVDEVMDIGLDLDKLATESGQDEGMDLDLGLDIGALEEDTGEEESAADSDVADLDSLDLGLGEEETDDAMDLDLGALDLGEEEVETPASEDLDFDLDLGGGEESEASAGEELDFELDLGGGEESEASAGEELDFDLDLGGGEESEASAGEELDFDLDLGGGEESEASAGEELDFDLDLGGGEESEASAGEELDFDLDLGGGEESETSAGDELGFDLDLGGGEESETTADSDMDFGLDLGASDEGDSVAAGDLDFGLELGGAEEGEEAGGGEMDFDLGLDTGGEIESSSDELDFDLNALATDSGDEAGTDVSDDLGLDLDSGSFDLGGLDEADLGDTSISEDSLDLDTALDELVDFGDLGDLDGGDDEMSTKLDLAQAYAEMGDAEGARTMLEEVVMAGNDEQKQQAQALIGRL